MIKIKTCCTQKSLPIVTRFRNYDCAYTTPSYQVSVSRTIGPLVNMINKIQNRDNLFMKIRPKGPTILF